MTYSICFVYLLPKRSMISHELSIDSIVSCVGLPILFWFSTQTISLSCDGDYVIIYDGCAGDYEIPDDNMAGVAVSLRLLVFSSACFKPQTRFTCPNWWIICPPAGDMDIIQDKNREWAILHDAKFKFLFGTLLAKYSFSSVKCNAPAENRNLWPKSHLQKLLHVMNVMERWGRCSTQCKWYVFCYLYINE